MKTQIQLWIDDERPGPVGWVLCKTAKEAIDIIQQHSTDGTLHEIDWISFDHDLGPAECGTGYDVAVWLEEIVHNTQTIVWLPFMTIHSANPVGRVRLDSAIKSMRHIVQRRIGGHL